MHKLQSGLSAIHSSSLWHGFGCASNDQRCRRWMRALRCSRAIPPFGMVTCGRTRYWLILVGACGVLAPGGLSALSGAGRDVCGVMTHVAHDLLRGADGRWFRAMRRSRGYLPWPAVGASRRSTGAACPAAQARETIVG